VVILAFGCSGSAAPHSVAPSTSAAVQTAPSSGPSTSPCAGVAVDKWTLRERAAQLIVIPALDGQLRELGTAVSAGAGGVLLLGNGTPADLAAQVADANHLAGAPLLVMADEEGGGVQRLAGRVDTLPWAREMAATMTTDEVKTAATRVGQQLLALGVNVDLAPVLDVDGHQGPNAQDPDGSRSFSPDPATAARYGAAFLEGLRDGGVMPVVKHFPGLGGASANTDYGPAATPPLGVLRTQGLVPFRAAIDDGVPAVMVANAVVPGLTSLPASISPAAIQTLLRGDFGFKGLVITDSLSANAVADAGYTVTQAAVAAIESGADMILFGSTLTAAQAQLLSPTNVAAETASIVDAIVAAETSGRLPLARLDQAVTDVLTVKHVTPCA